MCAVWYNREYSRQLCYCVAQGNVFCIALRALRCNMDGLTSECIATDRRSIIMSTVIIGNMTATRNSWRTEARPSGHVTWAIYWWSSDTFLSRLSAASNASQLWNQYKWLVSPCRRLERFSIEIPQPSPRTYISGLESICSVNCRSVNISVNWHATRSIKPPINTWMYFHNKVCAHISLMLYVKLIAPRSAFE